MMNSVIRQSEDRNPTRRDDIMPSLIRITGWFSLFLGFILFFIFQGRLDLVSSIAGGVVLLSILAVLMFTGNKKLVSPPPKISDNESKIVKIEVSDVEPDIVDELEVVNLENEEKLERSRKKRNLSPPPLPPMPVPSADSIVTETPVDIPPPMPLPPLGNVEPADGTKLAKKLVITSDAQSEMESEIEDFVEQRRSRQAEIRSSLERK